MPHKLLFIALLACILMTPIHGQTTVSECPNLSMKTGVADGFVVPAQVDAVESGDGMVRITSGGMLLIAKDYGGRLGVPTIDTLRVAIDPELTKVIFHEATGKTYYTKPDKNGISYLYEYVEKKPGKFSSRRVKPYGFSYSIDNPVFSSDGRVMVFSSNCPLGFGGRDLWFSEYQRGEWQYPRNLGHRINSEGNEIMPTIYGDFLIFSSNGREDSYGGFDLYSSRLVAVEQTGDTVEMFPIGRCPVYSLQTPFCSEDDDVAFSIDASGNGGWWVTDHRSDSTYDGSEGGVFHYFKGRMDCVRLTGVVKGADGNPTTNAEVTVRRKGADPQRVNSQGGNYCLFLQPGEEYELDFWSPDHFVSTRKVVAERGNSRDLYSSLTLDVELQSFFLDSVYRYPDLFGSSVSSDLSIAGKRRMDVVARFMKENEGLKLTIVSSYDQSADTPFCNLLNGSRLRSLSNYLVSQGVPLTRIITKTGTGGRRSNGVKEESSQSALAASSMTVMFVFSRN